MKLCLRTLKLVLLALTSTLPVVVRADSRFQHFVTAKGDQLMDGGQPLRFISFNIPNLLVVEDNVPFAEMNPWRLPDRFELTDALATIHAMGGTVARTYVVTVVRTNDAPGTPRHVLGPGRFNEDAFRAMDMALQIANEQGVRLIIPFVDNWSWQGGRAEYAGFRGKSKDDFWTDPRIITDFKQTIRFILLRTNTLTGVRYCDDKAVLCWETGNEIESPVSWTRDIAAYIKSLDHNHLVMDGFNASTLRQESLEMPEVDIVTTHHYPGRKESFSELIRQNWAKAKGRKPYIVGEFGFVDTAKMQDAMKTLLDTGASGGLLWSLRFRNRDGGFYWHSEPFGGNQYKAFHWPGSLVGAPYDEIELMRTVRQNAFQFRGLPVPPLAVSASPKLLPISDPAAISWQGSVGSTHYVVERAAKAKGPWTVVAKDVDEAFTQYRPLFADQTVKRGAWYYRVRAKNEAGVSEPSNVVGPVRAREATMVDELTDFSKVLTHEGNWAIQSRDCRQAKEDAHRAAGVVNDSLCYKVETPISGFRVYAFFPKDVSDLKFTASAGGRDFRDVTAKREVYFHGAGEYGYWKPVEYLCEEMPENMKFLKISLTGETQIGRVEIRHRASR